MTSRIILLFVTMLISSLLALGQSKEEYALTTDPIKLVQLFPNPTIDFLHVKFENPTAKKTKVTLHNIIGNAIEMEIEAIDDYELRIRVKDLPTGYYFLALRDESTNTKSSYKFLKR